MKDFFIIVHNIRSRFNVGSIFRTADALGVSKIYLTGFTPQPPHPKIDKVALGAERFVKWEHHRSAVSLVKKLKKENPKLLVVALENNLKSRKLINLSKFHPKFPLALVVGEETKGVVKSLLNLSDKIVEIPMVGKKESLNVSVAFGIVAYAICKKSLNSVK